MRIFRKLGLVNKVKSIAANLGILRVLSSDFNQWQSEHQEYEFAFHTTNQFRQSSQFMIETASLFESFGYNSKQFTDKVVIDVGAGSRLRGKYFDNSKLIAIEPLADRFMQEIKWCDLSDAMQVLSMPAEVFIDSLTTKADFVFSINVLDHCYDFKLICQNIYGYLKFGAEAFLSFDSHVHPSVGHPLILTKPICTRVFEDIGFEVIDTWEGFPQSFYLSHQRQGYDGQSVSISYKLRKR